MTTTHPLATDLADACLCEAPVGAIDPTRAAQVAKTFKALADPARVRLLSIIASAPGGDACVCDLTEPVGLSQPTVSHHMKILADAGLVTRRQQGRWAHFAVAPGARELLGASADAVLGRR